MFGFIPLEATRKQMLVPLKYVFHKTIEGGDEREKEKEKGRPGPILAYTAAEIFSYL